MGRPVDVRTEIFRYVAVRNQRFADRFSLQPKQRRNNMGRKTTAMLAVTLGAAVMVSGCSRGATRGGLIGGAAGAVVGDVTGVGTTEGAVVGGTAGAVIGDDKKR